MRPDDKINLSSRDKLIAAPETQIEKQDRITLKPSAEKSKQKRKEAVWKDV